jgi:hypothetical protein
MKYPENKVGQLISKTSFNNNWLLFCWKEVSENDFLFTLKQNVNVLMDAALDQFVRLTASQWHPWRKTESVCEQ